MAAIHNLRRRARRQRQQNRLIIERPRLNEEYNDVDFFARYRFKQATVYFIVNLLNLAHPSQRNRPLSPFLQVCVTLRYLAGAGIQQLCADVHDISTSTVCRTIWRVIEQLCSPVITSMYIKFPVNTTAITQGFYSLARFPHVVGCVDGTHVPIMKPPNDTHEYINRKGYASINVQMICDSRFRVMDCVAKWPGAIHDSRVFRTSQIGRDFENGVQKGVLLGDSAYACKTYMMTPFPAPAIPCERKYNIAHARTRVTVEQTFGIMKRLFGILQKPMRLLPVKACKAIVSCVVLHDIGIDINDIIPLVPDFDLDQNQQLNAVDIDDDDLTGYQKRIGIATTYFS